MDISLMNIISTAKEKDKNVTAYMALKQAGIIRNLVELLNSPR